MSRSLQCNGFSTDFHRQYRQFNASKPGVTVFMNPFGTFRRNTVDVALQWIDTNDHFSKLSRKSNILLHGQSYQTFAAFLNCISIPYPIIYAGTIAYNVHFLWCQYLSSQFTMVIYFYGFQYQYKVSHDHGYCISTFPTFSISAVILQLTLSSSSFWFRSAVSIRMIVYFLTLSTLYTSNS